MKTTISAKVKLHTTPEQFQALRQTQLAYRDALNFVSRYAFEHGKMARIQTSVSSSVFPLKWLVPFPDK